MTASQITASSQAYSTPRVPKPAKQHFSQDSLYALYVKSREDWNAWEQEYAASQRILENPAPRKKPQLVRSRDQTFL